MEVLGECNEPGVGGGEFSALPQHLRQASHDGGQGSKPWDYELVSSYGGQGSNQIMYSQRKKPY